MDVLVLLLIVIFIFGILGHYLFGISSNAYYSKPDWRTIGDSFYTLWVYVCADGWVPYQQNLSADGFTNSEFFTTLFIFLGNFIISKFSRVDYSKFIYWSYLSKYGRSNISRKREIIRN